VKLRSSLLVLTCLAAGCATTSASAPAAGEQPGATQPGANAEASARPASKSREELQALFQRELPALKKALVAPPQGGFSGEVEAAGTLSYEKGEGFTQLTVPLTEETDMECFVYEQRINAGAALTGILNHARESVKFRAVRPTDILVLKEAPAVLVETVYSVEQNGQTVGGQLRLMAHADNSVPLVCMLDAPGYAETFKRVATGLAASLQTTGDGFPSPRFTEVHVLRVKGQPVGFDWRALYEAKREGHTVDENISALLMPQAADQLLASDSTVFALTDAKGQVVELTEEEVGNGELQLQVSLEREKDRTYRYEGTHSGKPVKGTFQAPRGLTTEMAMAAAVKERLLSGKAKELSFAIYSPESNPAAPSDMVYRRDGKSPRGLTLQMGGIRLSATADDRGLFERYSVAMGGATMESERVFMQGTP
jgi:hypothetical protein